jgi:hypothetical protein
VGFYCGGLGRYSLYGVNGFVLGWWNSGVSTHRLIQKAQTPFGGTNPGTRKTQGKGELKGNQKQKYRPIDQNFKQTKKQHHPKRRDLASWVTVV